MSSYELYEGIANVAILTPSKMIYILGLWITALSNIVIVLYFIEIYLTSVLIRQLKLYNSVKVFSVGNYLFLLRYIFNKV